MLHRKHPKPELLQTRRRPQFAQQAGIDTGRDRDALAARWYASLDAGRPDFTIYDDPVYLAEAFLCWREYSRKYLRALRGLDRETVRLQRRQKFLDIGRKLG